MRLSVMGDEVGTTLDEQISSLKLANIKRIEIRKIEDKYLWEFEEIKLRKFKEKLKAEGIEVTVIDSPVGKKPMSYERKMELFEIYIGICKIFECKNMRIFSNIGLEIEKNEIIQKLDILSKKAYEHDINLLMENERATYAESPVDCLELIREYKNINIIYDLCNAFLDGHKVFDIYEGAKERIVYIHLRDYDKLNNKYAHLGEGDIQIERFMEVLKKDKFDGIISVETHLPMNEGKETKQELFLKSIKLLYTIMKKLNIDIK